MKKPIPFLLFVLGHFLFSALPVLGDVFWTIGESDASFQEFRAAGDIDAAGKLFKDTLVLRYGDDIPQNFPWILPGPADDWAGKKAQTVFVTFDHETNGNDEAGLELQLRGISQSAHPPRIEIALNGCKQVISTVPGATGDRILTDNEKAEWTSYRVFFPSDILKPTGNVLELTNVAGSWFVFDYLCLKRATGKITSLDVTVERGIFRGKDDLPQRRVRVDFKGGPLVRGSRLRFETEESAFTTMEQKLDPKSHFNGIHVDLPVEPEFLKKSVPFRVILFQENDAAPLMVECRLPEEKRWEIHLIHQTHLDIGYTHLQTDILKRQIQSIRDALKYIEETKDYPEEAKFKFHPEGMWAVEAFWAEATEEEKKAFVEAAKNRDMHIDALYAQAMTGMYNDEELMELFVTAVRFCREYDIPLDSAMQTDIPGNTWGLVTALAQNGIRYFSMGPNAGHRVGRLYEWGDKPFWWVSASGKEKVLCWILDTGYHQFHGKPLGHVLSEKEVFDILDGKDWLQRRWSGPRTFPYEDLVVIRYGIEGDNGRPNRILSDTVKTWNEKYLYPKLTISRNSDVMRLLEKRYGDRLPVVRGDLTPYWEDGSASTTEATSINRRACEKIIQAQALWSLFDPKNYPEADFRSAWTDLIMYDEHTWGAHNSISEPDSDFVRTQDEFKQEYARRGSRKTDRLVEMLSEKNDETFLLVNTLPQNRRGICFIGKTKNAPEKRLAYFSLDDGRIITAQYVDDPDGKGTCSTYVDLTHLADGPAVPGLGAIRLTRIKPEKEPKRSSPLYINAKTGEMGNDVLKLVVDKLSGAIRSLKTTGIEQDLVEAGGDGNRGLNDYLYILGRDAGNRRSRVEGEVTLSVVSEGPLAASMLIETKNVPGAASLKRQITVFADTEKIRIENVLDKTMERQPEGAFFAFPFRIPQGKWYIDAPWACVEVEKDQLLGANRNYYAVQRYGVFANETCGVEWVTVDANMVQFAPILFTEASSLKNWREKFDAGSPDGTLYSWVCNNHWETNYKAGQEGVLVFEYWIRPFAAIFDNGIAQCFAREIHQPLVLIPHDGKKTCRTPILFSDTDRLAVSSMKPACDGSGDIVVRIFNPTHKTLAATFEISSHFTTIFVSNTNEEREEPISRIKLAPFETTLLRLVRD